jgi:hypothetical protein
MAAPPKSFPPGYLEESRQGDLYAAATVPFFFAMVAVGLRFWSRKTMRTGWWLDDWLIFIALVSSDARVRFARPC